MATTQKKNSGGKTQRGRSAASSRSGKAAPRNRKPTSKAQARRRAKQRLTGGIVLASVAVLVLLGLCGVKAVVIDFLCRLFSSLVGYGVWLVVPVLLLSAWLLVFRQQEPAGVRVACACSLPVTLGALLHLFLAKGTYTLTVASLQALVADGQNMAAGGALSGIWAVAFTAWFSKVGAILFLFLATGLCFYGALHLSPVGIVSAFRDFRESLYLRDDREGYDDYDEYDEYDEYEEEPLPPPPPPARRPAPRRPVVDIALDDGPVTAATPAGCEKPQAKEPPPVEKKEGLLDKVARILSTEELEEPSPPHKETPEPSAARQSAPVQTPRVETAASNPVGFPASATASPPVRPHEVRLEGEAFQPTEEELKDLSPSQRKEMLRTQTAQVAKDIASGMETIHEEYQHPPLTLLQEGGDGAPGAVQEELDSIQRRLTETIHSFGIDARVSGAVRGPSVTRYEVELDQGVRLNKLTNLSDDIALALGASGVRIAPVPGKVALVGIEVPNRQVTPVRIREVLSSPAFTDHASQVAFSVGQDIGGNFIVGDVAKLPHLLIAGTTGSGKSVCTNSLIISMLYKSSPEEVRLIMVDPKMVELGVYNGIPHLLIPVVTDPKKAAGALQWAVTEMMKRYRTFADAGVRDIKSYNAYADKHEDAERLPQIVVVIDELADLMLVAAKEVEESICRVAQMGRASGMHLIIATQRPSADVITGLMKANIPSRIAFAVASSLESRIILDQTGAEKLVGKGDMLWFPLGSGKPLRVQGCLIGDDEVASVVDYVKTRGSADYDQDVLKQIEENAEAQNRGKRDKDAPAASGDGDDEEYDENFPAAVEVVLELGQASVSMLQRRLKLGYSRAARLVDQMEDRGIVGPFEGSKPRQLLITREQWAQMQGGETPVSEEAAPPPEIRQPITPESVISEGEPDEDDADWKDVPWDDEEPES